MGFKSAILAAFAAIGLVGFANFALADNEDLKCTDAQQSSWMSEDATKDMLMKQGFKEVRDIEVTDGHCYEVYAVDAGGGKIEMYLDPTSGNVVAKED
ncbi:MAG: PepSY domain-containing protein [Dongiaceae bacterium]